MEAVITNGVVVMAIMMNVYGDDDCDGRNEGKNSDNKSDDGKEHENDVDNDGNSCDGEW